MNLYVCLTPLQALIAGKINEKQKCNGHFIYVSAKDNNINKRIYHQIKKQMQLSFYIGEASVLWRLFRLFFILRGKKYNTVYLASIDNTTVHYILSYSIFERIETFDDGTLNLSYDGSYYKDNVNTRPITKIAHKILRKKYDRKKIQENSCKHYTIYKGMRNIISKVEFIDLFNCEHSPSLDKKGEVSIFLGSVYKDLCSESKNDLVSKLLSFLSEKENIYYIPHPREEDGEFFSKYYLDSSLYCNDLAEFIVIRMLDKYSKVNLYGFASSAQFNLLNTPGIHCYVVKHEGVNKVVDGIGDKLVQMGADIIVL